MRSNLLGMLLLGNAELFALATGEIVIAFVPRGTLTEGDEIELTGSGPSSPASLKAPYRRWAQQAALDGYGAVVVSVDPAAMLDPASGAARHIRADPGDGDLVVLRVFGSEGPVLSDEAFAARRHSVEGALRE